MRPPHLAVVEVNGEPEEEAGLSETFPTSHLKMGLVNSRVLGSVCRTKWSHQRFFFFHLFGCFSLLATLGL